MLVVQPLKCSFSRRRAGRALQIVTMVSAAALPTAASASPWDAGIQLPDNGRTAQKVELVDINADGWVDIVFANSKGEGVSGGLGNAEVNQVLKNDEGAGFSELVTVFEESDNAWTIKAGDVDNDGDVDLVVGDNFSGSLSYVLINDGGVFTREDIVGSANASIGDLELGDVDGDGDLDIFATDWGPLPHGQIDDPGGPLRLWLNDGDGAFSDGSAKLMMGMELLAAWSFDVELVDINNDYALDAMISTRGDADPAVVLLNDGKGNFSKHAVPPLQPMNTKNINVAFTPMDFDGDGFLDVVTLQDGGLSECVGDPPVCARRNSLLINDQNAGFTIPMNYWGPQDNPGKIDFDAATLDFNNDGRPDVVLTGVRLGPNENNSRLLVNDGTKFGPPPAPMSVAFPLVPQLEHTTALMFADFNHDGREDAVVAQREANLANYALFGRDDPGDGVAVDTTPPRIYDDGFETKLGTLLYFGEHAGFMARVNDYKTPTHWHDYLYDTALESYKLTGDGAALTTHMRRLPYMEFAFSLANPDDIKAMADSDPNKYIAPSTWFGEALWRVGFNVPYNGKKVDTLTWQYCAIDAASNKTCVGPFSVAVEAPETCGDGVVQEWEQCDGNTPTCVDCVELCGDGVCQDPPETFENCPEDCLCGNGVCDPGEPETCPQDCGLPDTDSDTGPECGDGTCEPGEVCDEDCGTTDGCNGVCEPTGGEVCPDDCAPVCGDNICAPGEVDCPDDCGTGATGDTSCPDTGPGADGQCQLDDDGCGCNAEPNDPRGLWGSLLLLGVFAVRRSRKRA